MSNIDSVVKQLAALVLGLVAIALIAFGLSSHNVQASPRPLAISQAPSSPMPTCGPNGNCFTPPPTWTPCANCTPLPTRTQCSGGQNCGTPLPTRTPCDNCTPPPTRTQCDPSGNCGTPPPCTQCTPL